MFTIMDNSKMVMTVDSALPDIRMAVFTEFVVLVFTLRIVVVDMGVVVTVVVVRILAVVVVPVAIVRVVVIEFVVVLVTGTMDNTVTPEAPSDAWTVS